MWVVFHVFLTFLDSQWHAVAFSFVPCPSPNILFFSFVVLRKLPTELHRSENGYDHRDAWFGVPPYGSTIQQNVYYANSTLCDDPSVEDYSRGGFPRRTRDSSHRMAPWKPPFILMIDRGECTFVMKVRNAQKVGATAVLVTDNTCLCDSADACVSDDKEATCYVDEPIMADDGTGADITIPSFLLFKQDGDPVKHLLMKDEEVRAEMSWMLPSHNTRVEYELWTTPKDSMSASIKKSFREIAVALGNHAQFTPHFLFNDGSLECFDQEGNNFCDTHCTSDGRYCATYDDYVDEGISGAMLVTETLRQICIWRLYGVDGVGLRWWQYIQEFESRCDKEVDGTLFGSERCVKDAMQRSGIDYNKVSTCIKSEGGIGEGDTNSFLEQELAARDAREKELDFVVPSFYVNQSPLRGAITTSVVFAAICAGFISGSEPPICKQCNKCSDVDMCIEIGFCPGRSNPNDGPLTFLTGSVIGVIVCSSILALLQWERSQGQMRGLAQGLGAEFMPLHKIRAVSTFAFTKDNNDEHEQTFELSKRLSIGT